MLRNSRKSRMQGTLKLQIQNKAETRMRQKKHLKPPKLLLTSWTTFMSQTILYSRRVISDKKAYVKNWKVIWWRTLIVLGLTVSLLAGSQCSFAKILRVQDAFFLVMNQCQHFLLTGLHSEPAWTMDRETGKSMALLKRAINWCKMKKHI